VVTDGKIRTWLCFFFDIYFYHYRWFSKQEGREDVARYPYQPLFGAVFPPFLIVSTLEPDKSIPGSRRRRL